MKNFARIFMIILLVFGTFWFTKIDIQAEEYNHDFTISVFDPNTQISDTLPVTVSTVDSVVFLDSTSYLSNFTYASSSISAMFNDINLANTKLNTAYQEYPYYIIFSGNSYNGNRIYFFESLSDLKLVKDYYNSTDYRIQLQVASGMRYTYENGRYYAELEVTNMNIAAILQFSNDSVSAYDKVYFSSQEIYDYLFIDMESDSELDYEDFYFKYDLSYQDFLISAYDPDIPVNENGYLELVFHRSYLRDTRVFIYDVYKNKFVSEFTFPNIDIVDNPLYVGFSADLQAGQVFRVITTNDDLRSYYLSKEVLLYNNILISEVDSTGSSSYIDWTSGETFEIDNIVMDIPDDIDSFFEVDESGNEYFGIFSDVLNIIFPSMDNLFSIINLFHWDETTDIPPTFTMDLSTFGAGEVSVIDFSFYTQYRETVFFWIKLGVGTYTFLKTLDWVKNMFHSNDSKGSDK